MDWIDGSLVKAASSRTGSALLLARSNHNPPTAAAGRCCSTAQIADFTVNDPHQGCSMGI